MKKPTRPAPEPFEAGPFDAKNALEHGYEGPLAFYLGDLAQSLSLLANAMYDPETQQSILNLETPTSTAPPARYDVIDAAFVARAKNIIEYGTEEGREALREEFAKIEQLMNEDECEDSFAQFESALENQSIELITTYLREASSVLSLVSKALEPTSKQQPWKLEFQRPGRGRPVNKWAKINKARSINQNLRFKTAKYGKQEAAIADLEENGTSRATVFRAKKAGKPTKKKKPKDRKRSLKSEI